MPSEFSTRQILVTLADGFAINPSLHISVKTTKSRLSLPNSAKIEVYNVKADTYKRLLTKQHLTIEVDGKAIFKGKILNVTNDYMAASWKCSIYCSDIKANPYQQPQFITIDKGTSNADVLGLMTAALSDADLDLSAFSRCEESKGSLAKQMVVEYQKEKDILKAMQNVFKGCDKEVVKEDGVVKILDNGSVPNAAAPLLFDRHLEPPKLSHKDIVVKVPIDTRVKLGLGFSIKSKSILKSLESPYTYENQFRDQVYRISEYTHEVDNFTDAVATTTVKGLNFG